MDNKEILRFCLKKGFLLDKDVLGLFSGVEDVESIKLIIDRLGSYTQQKIITKNIFENNMEGVSKVFLTLPKEKQKKLEKLKIKLGLSIEISKETSVCVEPIEEEVCNQPAIEGVKVFPVEIQKNKKLEVKDFVKYFKTRFKDMREILEEHSELGNLVSINKISGNRQGVSIIGLVSSKRTTKNKNILLEVEDLTGKIKVLINASKKDLYQKAEDIALDSVLGFKGVGNREIFFVNDIIFPESMLLERKNSPVEEYALFIGDLHFGSKKFLEKSFLKFITYLSGKLPNTSEVEKIKYLFVGGDLVTGIGNYPNQERDLKIKNLEEQFSELAELLGKIRKDIKIIICPGNHDCVRLMEPQPILDKRYAWAISELENVILIQNPSTVNIGAKINFPGFNVLCYHGFSFPFYVNNIPKLMLQKAANSPEKIMKYLLKNRHLAPTHKSVQYYPFEKDAHLIRDVPDIFFAGHMHKSGISYYNNILMISASCWEGKTPYQEKFGNEPDHCKVPLLNLKTRAIKILDFEEDEDSN
ncbi:MAG: metallophosphoesterase [Nanoarchaeota archaeon]|nr:metallophosphoesterase [Nanoarchaeota archaeon]MBU1028001.1 metallophosphoesterase [Nanoarchaeota archaeon]